MPRTPLLIGLACLLLGGGLGTLAPQQLDYPVVLWLNRFATRSALLDNVAHALTSVHLLMGGLLVAGIWLVWFDASEPLARTKVVAGMFAASLAAVASRGLELALSMHPRPLVDAALPFVPPLDVDPGGWNDWNSFPSDTAALLFGLAMVIALIRPRIGFIAFAWALCVCSARVYEGFHYPTDILAGAGLGVTVVCTLQHQAFHRFCFSVTQWADRRPGIFYSGAFLASYSVAQLFEDIRLIGKGLAAMFLHF
jgi:undecaprenyl-diphosphatase